MTAPQPTISVCLCSHNPRPEYLRRTLESLARQSHPADRWELIIIDNASDPPLASLLGQFACLPAHSLVCEPQAGLVRARLRAIAESRGELLIFFDDDNLPSSDYLERALERMEADPKLGIAGGRVLGEFEIPPALWVRPFLPYLAIRDHGDRPIIGGESDRYHPWYPIGAGMILRREVALRYADQLAGDDLRVDLDRLGGRLTGGGDIDMVMTALEGGWLASYFPDLTIRHLIPAGRLRLGYLRRLLHDTHASCDHYYYQRGIGRPPRRWPLEYPACMAQFLLRGALHPLALYLATRAARGRYRAWHAHQRKAP